MDPNDPNAALFGANEPEPTPEEAFGEYVFGKIPNRVSAIFDLVYNNITKEIDGIPDLPEEGKRQMIFKLTSEAILNMVLQCVGPDIAEEVAIDLDSFIGLNCVNTRFQVDLISEVQKALVSVKQEEDESDEDFERRLGDLENQWWDIPQPLLNKRTPNDAIREEMNKYGLNE